MPRVSVQDYDSLREKLAEAVARAEVKEKLFVYGIFLDQGNREDYGMLKATYATQPGFKTVGSYIVRAVRTDSEEDSLTGLLINNTDAVKWDRLDGLEAAYKRIAVEEWSQVTIWVNDGRLVKTHRVPIEVGEDLESIQAKVLGFIDSELANADIHDFEVDSEITYMYVDPSVDGKDYSTYAR